MTLRFEEGDDFGANLERFLTHMEGEDPGMSAILRAHAATLLKAHDDASRRMARTQFNFSVGLDLQDLLEKSPEKDAD